MKTAAGIVLILTAVAAGAYVVIVQHVLGKTIVRQSLSMSGNTVGPVELKTEQNPFRVNVTIYYRAPFVFSTTYTCRVHVRDAQGKQVWQGERRLKASSSRRRNRSGGVTITVSGRRSRKSVSSSVGVFRIEETGPYTLECDLDGKTDLFRSAEIRLVANAALVQPFVIGLIVGVGGVVAGILFVIGLGRSGSGRIESPPSRGERPVVEAQPVE